MFVFYNNVVNLKVKKFEAAFALFGERSIFYMDFGLEELLEF